MPSTHRIQPSPGVPQAFSLGYAGRRRIRRASRVHRPAGVRWNADTSRSGADADVSTSAPEREERGGRTGGVRKNAAVRPPHILLTRNPQNAERNHKSRRPPKKNTTGA